MKGKGYVILIVGRKDAGKTTQAKKIVATCDKEPFVFDYRGDWTGNRNVDFDGFISKAVALKDSCIVCEEGTVFMSSDKRDKRILDLLTGASHNSNIVIMLFHSWSRVPTYILDQTDFYYCLKTNDNPDLVRKKFGVYGELLNVFEAVQKNKMPHFYVVRKNVL